MSNFGEQPSVNRERTDKNIQSAEDVKKKLAEATASGNFDTVMELAGEAKRLKGEREEFENQDMDEAIAENTEREMDKVQEEAIKENQERDDKMMDEANEMNKQFDETKATEKVEDLKKQLQTAIESGDFDKVAELGKEMKGLMPEKKKDEDSEQEKAEQARKSAEKDATKLAEVRAKINGENISLEQETSGEKKEEDMELEKIKKMIEKTEKLFEMEEDYMSKAESLIESQRLGIEAMPVSGERHDESLKLSREVANTLRLGGESSGGIDYVQNPNSYGDRRYATAISFIDTIDSLDGKKQEFSKERDDFKNRLEDLKKRGQEVFKKLVEIRKESSPRGEV